MASTKAKILSVIVPMLFTMGLPGLFGLCSLGNVGKAGYPRVFDVKSIPGFLIYDIHIVY